jgi:hypothetical protein
VVKDIIDLAKFDIASLIPVHGSASFTTKISNTNQVEFIFQNINLPFATGSNTGFVAFKIKLKSTLVLGNSFSNSANIYFDYNFPIVTDTYTTTIAALTTQDFEFKDYFAVYPNPAQNVLNIISTSSMTDSTSSMTDSTGSLTVSSISVYNMLGQLVFSSTGSLTGSTGSLTGSTGSLTDSTGSLTQIDVSQLKTGNYFIKITTNKGSANNQFVKE